MLTNTMWVPRASDCSAWRNISSVTRNELLCAADAHLLDGGYPALTATQYMAYVRDGSRTAFEAPYFQRRKRLLSLMLAECLTAQGKYLDEVIDGIWCICEETTWFVSAHNLSGQPLAEADDPCVDLFAAQTASLLSWCAYLLEGILPDQIIRRVRREVTLRVLDPFFARDDFWWMGVIRKDLNNWTPWILSNVLASAHIWSDSRDTDGRAMVMLDRWLACIPPDGGLDEGVSYWNMAGGSLLDCLEHLGADRFGESKIRNLAAFPLRTHIGNQYFLNFADCDACPVLDGERVYTFGLRAENSGLMTLGAALAATEPSVLPADTPETYRVLCKLFHPLPAPGSIPHEDATLPDSQLWVRRHGGLFAAIKGGHNAESHNHNDVGTFIVYLDGEPAIVDAGNMVYTAKTFQDATRYTLWNTRSTNHNLPLIGEWEQAPGEAYAAQNVAFGPESASMDISGAYPSAAGVKRLHRKLSLVDRGLTLTDEISLSHAAPVTWVYLLRHAPTLKGCQARTGNILLQWNDGLAAACTEYPVTDPRMAKNYPGSLYRLTLTAPCQALHTHTFHIARSMP